MDESTARVEPAGTEGSTTLETLPPPGPGQLPHPVAPPTQPLAPHQTTPTQPLATHQTAGPVGPPAGYPPSYTPGAYAMPTSTSRPGLVLGIISLIASGLALLGVIGLATWVLAGQPGALPAGVPSDFGPPPAPLTGQLSEVPNGRQVAAADLTAEIRERLEEDGWLVEDMRCPQVTGLAQGTVSVCHSTMDDGEWAVIVFFEDAKGTYTLSLV